MQTINDNPIIYERDDGTCVLFMECYNEQERREIKEVPGTLDFCLGYYVGCKENAPSTFVVGHATLEEFTRLRQPATNECDNCGEAWSDNQLLTIRHYFQRVNAGATVPSGECPACGCLCYPIKIATNRCQTVEPFVVTPPA